LASIAAYYFVPQFGNILAAQIATAFAGCFEQNLGAVLLDKKKAGFQLL